MRKGCSTVLMPLNNILECQGHWENSQLKLGFPSGYKSISIKVEVQQFLSTVCLLISLNHSGHMVYGPPFKLLLQVP